jgi:hypothetical protein
MTNWPSERARTRTSNQAPALASPFAIALRTEVSTAVFTGDACA